MSEFFATQDQEVFKVGPFKTREEAIKRAAMQEGWADGLFWVGELVQVAPPKLDAKDMLEAFHSEYEEKVGEEAAGNWPFETVEQKHIDKLGHDLNEVLCKWMIEHKAIPEFGTIENITEHDVSEGSIEATAKATEEKESPK